MSRKKLENLEREQVALQVKVDGLSVWRKEAIMEVVAHAMGVCDWPSRLYFPSCPSRPATKCFQGS